MNNKKSYTDEFKLKVVLDCLKEENTINGVASKFEVHPANIKDWKRKFLDNAVIVFSPEKGVTKYKDKIKELHKREDELYREIGKLTAQVEWAKKKSKEFNLGF